MTDHEAENIRTLFREADLEHVPASRDLIGPAVAWGDGRRRRDRWTAAGVTGAVAAVAVAGVVALRPGHGAGSDAVTPGVSASTQSTAKPHTAQPTAPPTPTLPKLTGTIVQQEQEVLDALKPYLPTGDHIACQTADQPAGFCTTLTFTSSTGGTSIVQVLPGDHFIQAAPVDTKYIHQHPATAAIPLVSGTKEVSGGTVRIQSTDIEARDSIQDTAALTDPSALSFHSAQYVFAPPGSGTSWTIELDELVRELPWKGSSGVTDEHGVFGFNPSGPVLSPEQFAALVSAPIFPAVMQQLGNLRTQMEQNQTQSQSK
ncbi:hypothetical protein ABH920_008423 [Catenulispora sp. EB89]|uniref:hypothetical protein n=1 Tax=Catenulispora sp. EB89 TaxID=3156257 RepID=UPI003518B2E2